jgi:hypothetical protein
VLADQVECDLAGRCLVHNGFRKGRLEVPPGEEGAVGIIINNQKSFGHEERSTFLIGPV